MLATVQSNTGTPAANLRYEPFTSKSLKKLRKEKEMSQQALADATGIPLATIKKWESDAVRPTMDKLEILGEYFDLYFYADWKKETPDEPGH